MASCEHSATQRFDNPTPFPVWYSRPADLHWQTFVLSKNLLDMMNQFDTLKALSETLSLDYFLSGMQEKVYLKIQLLSIA